MAITADWLSSHPLKNLNQEKRSMRGPCEPLNNVFRQDTSGKQDQCSRGLAMYMEATSCSELCCALCYCGSKITFVLQLKE